MALPTDNLYKEPIIFLDMDGVCCDFLGGVAHWLNYDVSKLVWVGRELSYKGVTVTEEFWDAITLCSEPFWQTLKPFPWFEPLYEELSKLAKVVFLSSPSYDGRSMSGKKAWLSKFFGASFLDFSFTCHKTLLAAPNRILIDDFEDNVRSFTDAGGIGMLFSTYDLIDCAITSEQDYLSLVSYYYSQVEQLLNSSRFQ